jgi:hypothetical protein
MTLTDERIEFGLNNQLEDPSKDEVSGFYAGARWAEQALTPLQADIPTSASTAVQKAIKRFNSALACSCHRSGRHQPWCRVFDGNTISDEDKSDLRVAALVLSGNMPDNKAAHRILATLARLGDASNMSQPTNLPTLPNDEERASRCCAGARGPSVEQKCVTCPFADPPPCSVCGGNERGHAGYLLCECPATSLHAAGAAGPLGDPDVLASQ